MIAVFGAMLTGLALVAAEPMTDSEIVREGQGEHRQVLDEAELQPFDVGLFSKLTEWKNGSALTADAIDNKVVAIVFWKNDEPVSLRAVVPTLKRLDMTYGGDGLVTLAVHPQDQWDQAQSRIDSGLFNTLIGYDSTGEFAEALHADDYPDVYLIDRAGQLRFADIDHRQLPTAVRGLIRETREEAKSAGQRRAEAAAEAARRANADAQREAARQAKLAEELKKLPPKPSEQAYASAHWPTVNEPKALSGKDVQGHPLPVSFGKNETWLTEPVPLEGRAVILDFWATWCGPCVRASPKLDRLQKQYKDDLVVIGVSGQRAGAQYPEDPDSVKAFLEHHKVSYSHVNDLKQSVCGSLQIRGIPLVVVMSSDGIVRWEGNPLDPAFEKIVKAVVENDPWVIARHASE